AAPRRDRVPRDRQPRVEGVRPGTDRSHRAAVRGGAGPVRERAGHPRAADGKGREGDPHRAAGEAAAGHPAFPEGAPGAEGARAARVGDTVRWCSQITAQKSCVQRTEVSFVLSPTVRSAAMLLLLSYSMCPSTVLSLGEGISRYRYP